MESKDFIYPDFFVGLFFALNAIKGLNIFTSEAFMSILFLAREVSEKTIDTVALISIAAVALLILILAVIAVKNKGYTTKQIVFAAITVACSFVLSFIKFTPVAYGGSITLASFVPILIYAYYQGFTKALAAGIIFGLLNFIQSPYILVPETFLLDYILAFGAIGVMGFASKISKNQTLNILTGTALVYLVRLVMHVVSGVIYFKAGYVLEGLPDSNAFIYSLIYNLVYLAPDMIICLICFYTLIKTNAFNKITETIKK